MKIPAALQPAVDLSKIDSISLLKLLKPGQLLQARVAAATQNGLAKLLVGRAELMAKTRVQLQEGEKLQLRVEKGLPQPELKIMRNDARQAVRTLLQHAMARQLPPSEVQQSLRQLPPPPKTGGTAAQQVLRVLVPDAPTPRQVSASNVRQALDDSGIFFEPRLSRGQVSHKDQKFQLLQLMRLFTPAARTPSQGAQTTLTAQAQTTTSTSAGERLLNQLLRHLVPQGSEASKPVDAATGQQAESKLGAGDQLLNRLQRLVEGSLGRIQSHQAGTLANEEPGRQVWQFEMPIQLSDKLDHLHIRIQGDQDPEQTEEDASRVWKVDIEFNFDNLGEISSRINLRGEHLTASFWSQRESTAKLIGQTIPRLEEALAKAGLQIGLISSLTGPSPRTRSTPNNLLDEHA